MSQDAMNEAFRLALEALENDCDWNVRVNAARARTAMGALARRRPADPEGRGEFGADAKRTKTDRRLAGEGGGMSAHTPGPWTVEPVTSPWHSPLIYADAHVGPIAEIRPRLDLAASHPMVVATSNANARLIAAAPDLLEALTLMVSHWPHWAANMDMQRIDFDAVSAARAAIRKATEEGA